MKIFGFNSKQFVCMLAFLIILLCFHSVKGQEVFFPDPEVTISMDLQDANLKDVLKVFSIQSGLNFIASEGVQDRKITLYLDRVPIQEAMDKLFRANGLYYELNEDSNVFIVRDWGKPTIETVTRVFRLKYAAVSSSPLNQEKANTAASFKSGGSNSLSATAEDDEDEEQGITSVIEKLLSEYGSVIEDKRTNSIIVNDIPSKIPMIAQLIASLDVPQPQVMLEVEMLDVQKKLVDRLGFNFGENPLTYIVGSKRNGIFFGNPARKDFTIESDGVAGNVIFGKTYAQLLNLLRQHTDTRYLARPRILTLNNETAEIKITTQEAVGEKKSVSGEGATTTTTEAERFETGVSLRVTPQINIETGEITMYLIPTVAEASASEVTSSTNVAFRDPEVRSTRSIVRVMDGETVVLGGLIRNELSQTVTKVPILGDIPIAGALFRHKNKEKDRERELLIFITPRVIKDSGIELARSKSSAVLVDREQDLLGGTQRKSAISSSLNRFDKRR